MGSRKIASNLCRAITTIFALVFCCLRGAVVLAWTIATQFQVKTPKATSQTDKQENFGCISNQTYSTKYEQMKIYCVNMNDDICEIAHQNKLMQKQIMLLEDTLHQEKRNHEASLIAIRGEFKFRDNLSDRALTVSQNTNAQMQRQIQMLEDSEIYTKSNIQKLVEGLHCLDKKITSFPPIDRQVIKKLDDKMDKLQDTLLAGKKSSTRAIKVVNKKIVGLRSEIAILKRNRCNNDELRDDVNKLRADLNDLEGRFKKQLTESARSKDVNSETTNKMTRKYDRLKLRLSLVENNLENVSSLHTRNTLMGFAAENNNVRPTNILGLGIPPAPPAPPTPPMPPALPAPPAPPMPPPAPPMTPAPPAPPAPPVPPASPEPPMPPAPSASLVPLTPSAPPMLTAPAASPETPVPPAPSTSPVPLAPSAPPMPPASPEPPMPPAPSASLVPLTPSAPPMLTAPAASPETPVPPAPSTSPVPLASSAPPMLPSPFVSHTPPEQSLALVSLVMPVPTETPTPLELSAPSTISCTKDSCATGDSCDPE